jgi:hypothetical protein
MEWLAVYLFYLMPYLVIGIIAWFAGRADGKTRQPPH